jgi:DNA-binding response OmpR family regulator
MRLLLVEDDRALSTGLADAFALEQFEVAVARDGVKGHELLARSLDAAARFDVVVLDLMLPGRSGLDLLRELRGRDRATPVLILTARGAETDKVLGLELGADDYVTKPFSLRELVARVRALVRRSSHAKAEHEPARDAKRAARFRVGDAEVDLAAFEVRRAGAVHALSRKEAAMLELLERRRGEAVSREQFLRDVWGGGDHVTTRTIDMHVLHLRQKLERDSTEPRHLITVHGVGYRLVQDERPAPDRPT